MNQFAMRSIFLLLLSGFGLISCAPDKSSKKLVADPFELNELEIQISKTGQTRALGSKSAFSTALSTEDVLIFKSLKAQLAAGDPVALDINTQCRSASASFEAQTMAKNQAELRIRDLMPAGALFQPDLSHKPFSCFLDIQASNKHGSRHRASLTLNVTSPESDLELGIKLAPRLDLTHHELKTEARALRLSTTQAQDITFPGWRGENGESFLLCEGFHAQLKLDGHRDLTLADLISQKALKYDSRELFDGRNKPSQICRVALVSTEGPRTVKASASFHLQFPASPLKVKSTWVMDRYKPGYLDATPAQITVFEIRIQNPLSVAVPVAIPLDKTGGLQLAPATKPLARQKISTYQTKIEMILDGARALPSETHLLFVLDAGKEAVVTGLATVPFTCQAWVSLNSGNTVPTNVWFEGFFYDFDPESFPLLQSANNRLESDGTLKVVYSRTLLDPPGRPTHQPLPRFAPWTTGGKQVWKNPYETICGDTNIPPHALRAVFNK